MRRLGTHTPVFTYGTLVLAVVIPFSTKMATGCLIMLGVDWLLAANLRERFRAALTDPFVVLCMMFYVLELSGLLYTNHLREGLYHAQTEASFLAIPLIYSCQKKMREEGFRDLVMKVFCLSVVFTSLYCLSIGGVHYFRTGDSSALFYHSLVAPVHQHAVYFSMYVFICVAFLTEGLKKLLPLRKVAPVMILLAYFCLLLFLLRSKMVVGFTMLYAIFQLLRSLKGRKVVGPRFAFNVAVIVAVPLALFTQNPFSREAYKIKESDFAVLSRKGFDQDDYFDEVQLRLLLWKFSIQILDRTGDWWAGVSPGDARSKINDMVREKNMYTGEPGTRNKGYLNYNLHDQYLETLFRSGLAGLLLLLAILFFCLAGAIHSHNEVFLAIVLLFAAVFLTESVLERQIGIVPFFFFICLLRNGKEDHGLFYPTAG